MISVNSRLAKPIFAWCLYDWAAASVSIIVTTFIFATYFTTHVAENQITGTYQWANATSIAGIIIAICSPLFGAIADHGGHHKRWLFFFTLVAIVSSGLLWFSYPSPHSITFTLICFATSLVGLEVALVFYNSFLPMLSPRKYLGRISGWGWGFGYLGGIISLTLTLVFFVKTNFFSLDTETYAQIRICGPFVSVWYFIFALPFFFIVKDLSTASRPMGEAIRVGTKELWSTIKKLPKEKNILMYLLSHMIYTDGLNTLFAFGGIYAAGTYGLTFEEVLLFGITINVAAGLGAVLLGWVDDAIGSKPTVIISLLCLAIIGLPILFLHNKWIFWGISLIVCLFVGPVQSASRSLMVHLIEGRSSSTEMFGLYALSGRITSFIGPLILGMVTLHFESQRAGMLTVLVFFILGVITLLPVKIDKKLPDSVVA